MTMIESQAGLNNPSEHWLSTHHLPLRQIAPLYSLTSMAHDSSASSNPYAAADAYKPQDGFTTPSTTYDQYNAAANSPPGAFYPSNSYGAPSSYPVSYKQNEIQDTQHPNTYSTSYHKQNEFNGASPSNLYAVPSYPNQNEFNGAPTPLAPCYRNSAASNAIRGRRGPVPLRASARA